MVGSGLEWAALTASLECSGCTWKERKGGRGGREGEGEARGTDGFSFTYWSFKERVLGFDRCLKLTRDKLQVICQ